MGKAGMVFRAALALAALALSACAPALEPPALRTMNAKNDLAALRDLDRGPSAPAGTAELPARPLTLDDCVAHALANNLDAKAMEQEKAVHDELVTAQTMRLLPSLIADAERSWKDRHVPQSSESFASRQTSLEPSISSEKESAKETVELSWNLLNLAVNTARLSQAQDRRRMVEARYARARQNLALETARAYLRAVIAQEALALGQDLAGRARERQALIERQRKGKLVSAIESLQNEIDTLGLVQRLEVYEDEAKASRVELSRIMGLPPGTLPVLAGDAFAGEPAPMELDMDRLEEEAVRSRPELAELDQEEGVTRADATLALAQMFPSLTPYVRYEHDANRYLTRHDWYVTGLKLSHNLLSLPQAWAERRAGLKAVDLVRRKRLAMTAGVIAQVNLAVIERQDALKRHKVAVQLEDRHRQLMEAVAREVRGGMLQESSLLQSDQQYLAARVARIQAQAMAETARIKILNSVGRAWEHREHPTGAAAPKQAPAAPDLSVPLDRAEN